MNHSALYEFLGRAWTMKVARVQRKVGTLQAARNLRKQGVPLTVAMLLLTGQVLLTEKVDE